MTSHFIRVTTLALSLAAVAPGALAAAASAPPDGLYRKHCAECHEGGVPRAPHSVKFQILGPTAIYEALTRGVMQEQGAALSDAEKRQLAEFLGGAALPAETSVPAASYCKGPAAKFDRRRPPDIAGWGITPVSYTHLTLPTKTAPPA